MCGLAGYIDPDGPGDAQTLTRIARRMGATLCHRGPDDSGEWVSPGDGVAFAFRRLAILDLSAAGSQPMHSPGGRYVLVFNGEIYNHAEVWERLGKETNTTRPSRRGHSDTEVLLVAIEEWGLEKALTHCTGMFALALWDRLDRSLQLARDRIGEKPLYYGCASRAFVFASELKAIRAAPRFDSSLNRGVIAAYMRDGYISAPDTIYQNVFKLPAGTILNYDPRHAGTDPRPLAYWDARREAAAAASDPFRGTEREAVDELDRLLRQAVDGQMRADVPVGALLSGGVDSSVVVGLMQSRSPRPVKTFTVGFAEKAFDETSYARRVADYLGTNHTEISVGPAEALAEIPSLAAVYDEPFADASAIPTLLISRLARECVTVVLSGDGGDELFGGYPWYSRSERIWRSVGWMPRSLRVAAGYALRGLSAGRWDRVLRSFGSECATVSGDRIHKMADLIERADSANSIYRDLSDRAPGAAGIVLGAVAEPVTLPWESSPPHRRTAKKQMYRDLVRYLPDNCLVKVDRATMSLGLELRTPLLDHRVVEFSLRLPVHWPRGSKWPLRGLARRYFPRGLVDRPKQGFCVPIGSWLRGPLRSWAEDLLDSGRLRRDGLLDAAAVQRTWAEHLSGTRNWQYSLWHVLLFQSWMELERTRSSASRG